MDCSPPGSSVHRDSSGKGSHSLLQGIFPTQGIAGGSLPSEPHVRSINALHVHTCISYVPHMTGKDIPKKNCHRREYRGLSIISRVKKDHFLFFEPSCSHRDTKGKAGNTCQGINTFSLAGLLPVGQMPALFSP